MEAKSFEYVLLKHFTTYDNSLVDGVSFIVDEYED